MGIRTDQIPPGVPRAAWLQGGGEMGALIRSSAWDQTPVGPIAFWPQSLRTALGIILETRFPMYVAWGPELTQFYNDAYRQILGASRHPAALGRSSRETFADVWDLVGPVFESILQGRTTGLGDFMWPLDRPGSGEAHHLVCSCSPIRNETEGIGGVLVTVMENTARGRGTAPMQTPRDLAATPARTTESQTGRCEGIASLGHYMSELARARRQAEQAEQALHEESRVNEALHRIGRLLTAELELDRLVQIITDEATTLCRAEFGAFFYNVVNDRGESYLLYTLSGVPRECFAKFPAPRNTALFGPTFRGEGVLRIDDVIQDPRYGHNPPYHGMPEGHLPVRSYLAVPVVSRSGEVLGGLFFGHSQAGVFTARDERLLVAVAAQGAAAIDNARLFRQTRTAQEESLRLFEEARRSRAAAESASRAKDEFLAILGHELRNPLAPILTALHLMRLRGGDVHEKERTVIERQVAHLTRLVDDLLDVSRITRGKVELKMQRIELADVVAKGIELASPLLEQRQHVLSVSVPRPSLVVNGDPVRLGQVVSNLLTNAAKYTETGGRITVEGACEGTEIVLRVRDTGIGISPDMLPRVFDLFIQEPQALDRSQGGLGLGLPIVRSLVNLHGGTVSAYSEGEGQGTEFTIRLPAAPLCENAPDQPRATRPLTAPRSVESRRILIVDDNEDAVELLAESLELVGHVVRVAYDGPSALRVAATFLPELALLDIGLPVMDGYELARRLREHPGPEHLRLVAVTGYGQDTDRQRSQKAGFDAHLVKPVQLAELMSVIRELMKSTGGGQ